MSATTIKRGARRGKAKKSSAAKRGPGVIDRSVAALPMGESGLRRLFRIVFLAALLAIGWAVAVMAGVPERARERVAQTAANAGLIVRRIEVHGVEQMDREAIFAKAMVNRAKPMPEVDLTALRDQLVALAWVADARVSRQLPDTLVIDIVERKPHAVLREGENFVLIDPSGHRLEAVPRGRAEKMLVLSGEGAASGALDLDALLDETPAIKPRVRGAEWIGNRRWNLTFDTGQVLALPEGEDAAIDALAAFARLDARGSLIGGRVMVFDMRTPDRSYMRVPGWAEEQAELSAERKKLEAEAARLAGGG